MKFSSGHSIEFRFNLLPSPRFLLILDQSQPPVIPAVHADLIALSP